MSGTSTSQLQYTGSGFDAFRAAGVATALMTAQPAFAEALAPCDRVPPLAEKAVKPGARAWVETQLRKLEALPINWDGYGADPIHPGVLRLMGASLEQMLPITALPGNVVPGADGSLQAEWHLERASFGLLVESDGTLSCWVRPINTPEIERFGLAARDLFQSAVLTYLS